MIAVRIGSLEHLKMAIRLRENGDLNESLRMLQEITETRIKEFGRDSDETAMALSQLGRTLLSMGEYDAACELHQEVYRNRRTLLGILHQHTLNSAAILLNTLFCCEKLQEMNELIQEILTHGAGCLENIQHPASGGVVDVAVKLIMAIREKCINELIEQRVLSYFRAKPVWAGDLMRLVSQIKNNQPIILEDNDDPHIVVHKKTFYEIYPVKPFL